MARTIIDELVTLVSFENDSKGLDEATNSIADFKFGALALLAPVAALLSGKFFIESMAENVDVMVQFADTTGVAIEALQDLEFAAEQQGGSIDGLRSSIENLSKKTGEAFTFGTGDAVDIFNQLGISLVGVGGGLKSATDLMLELNKAFQTLSRGEQLSIAAKLGIDTGTTRLLQLNTSELNKLIRASRDAGRVTTEQALAASKLNKELVRSNSVFERNLTQIALAVIPIYNKFNEVLEDVIEFVKDNSQFFIILGTTLGVLSTAAVLASTAFGGLADSIIRSTLAFLGSPTGLILAAFLATAAAIALLVDDVITFFRGGRSLIEPFAKDIKEVMEGIFGEEITANMVKRLRDLITNFSTLSGGEIVTSIIDILTLAVDPLVAKVKEGLDSVFGEGFTDDLIVRFEDAQLTDLIKVMGILAAVIITTSELSIGAKALALIALDKAVDEAVGFFTPEPGPQFGPQAPPQFGPQFIPETNERDFFGKTFDFLFENVEKPLQNFFKDVEFPTFDFFKDVEFPTFASLGPILTPQPNTITRLITLPSVTVNIDAPGANGAEIAATVGNELKRELRTAVEDNDSSIKR